MAQPRRRLAARRARLGQHRLGLEVPVERGPRKPGSAGPGAAGAATRSAGHPRHHERLPAQALGVQLLEHGAAPLGARLVVLDDV